MALPISKINLQKFYSETFTTNGHLPLKTRKPYTLSKYTVFPLGNNCLDYIDCFVVIHQRSMSIVVHISCYTEIVLNAFSDPSLA